MGLSALEPTRNSNGKNWTWQHWKSIDVCFIQHTTYKRRQPAQYTKCYKVDMSTINYYCCSLYQSIVRQIIFRPCSGCAHCTLWTVHIFSACFVEFGFPVTFMRINFMFTFDYYEKFCVCAWHTSIDIHLNSELTMLVAPFFCVSMVWISVIFSKLTFHF